MSVYGCLSGLDLDQFIYPSKHSLTCDLQLGPKSKSSLSAHSASATAPAAASINSLNLAVDQSSSYTSLSSSSTTVGSSSSTALASSFSPLQQQTFATSSKPTISQVKDVLQVNSTFKPKSFVGTMHFISSAPIVSRYEDIEVWKHMDFYMSQIPDPKGICYLLPLSSCESTYFHPSNPHINSHTK